MVDEADMCFASAATVFATRHNFGLNSPDTFGERKRKEAKGCLDGEGRWPRTIDTLLCGRCFIQLSYPSMMAGQARQIALRKLEVAVLSHGAFQAQRNGFCALLSDVLACYLSFTHASRHEEAALMGGMLSARCCV